MFLADCVSPRRHHFSLSLILALVPFVRLDDQHPSSFDLVLRPLRGGRRFTRLDILHRQVLPSGTRLHGDCLGYFLPVDALVGPGPREASPRLRAARTREWRLRQRLEIRRLVGRHGEAHRPRRRGSVHLSLDAALVGTLGSLRSLRSTRCSRIVAAFASSHTPCSLVLVLFLVLLLFPHSTFLHVRGFFLRATRRLGLAL